MKRRRDPEQQIQRAVFQHIAARGAPGLFAFAVPNGGWRTKAEAAIFKGLGVKPGVPDICLIHDGKPYFLELKAEGGKPSDTQLLRIDEIMAAGADVAVAYGLDRAIEVLEKWGLLRGTVHA